MELKDFYLKMKNRIKNNQNVLCKNFETQFLDRNYFKREKPQKKQEKMVAKFEVQIRQEQEQRKKIRHMEFMNVLFNHQVNFKTYS